MTNGEWLLAGLLRPFRSGNRMRSLVLVWAIGLLMGVAVSGILPIHEHTMTTTQPYALLSQGWEIERVVQEPGHDRIGTLAPVAPATVYFLRRSIIHLPG